MAIKLSQEKIDELARNGKIQSNEGKRLNEFSEINRDAKPPVPVKGDVAQAMELIAKTISDTQANNSTQLRAIVALIQQKPVVTQASVEKKKLEKWKFDFVRNDKGIVSATATQIE